MSLKVIIPVYTLPLRREEAAALDNNLRVLSRHDITLLAPEGLDVSPLTDSRPELGVMRVSSQWLGTERGITGYNDMMLSRQFYDLFADVDFILICHVDAWLFRDDLEYWVSQPFDIVAAPWPMRPRYRHFPLRQWLKIRRQLSPKGEIIHQDMFGRIGNGGLCLRRVRPFAEACTAYHDEAEHFLEKSKTNVLYNEDLFWALVPDNLRRPSVETALKFAFDLKPELCFELNGRRLPMGCHGFNKPVRQAFWRRFISLP